MTCVVRFMELAWAPGSRATWGSWRAHTNTLCARKHMHGLVVTHSSSSCTVAAEALLEHRSSGMKLLCLSRACVAALLRTFIVAVMRSLHASLPLGPRPVSGGGHPHTHHILPAEPHHDKSSHDKSRHRITTPRGPFLPARRPFRKMPKEAVRDDAAAAHADQIATRITTEIATQITTRITAIPRRGAAD